uniref:Uncharacterized protein n=1 Tax=viral metagenome TaxID=1070528 RepID=A0A6C0KTU6_9ZZZZ
MSHSLFYKIGSFINALDKITTRDRSLTTTLLGLLGGGHALYAYGTNTTENIIVENKYKMVLHGSTQFMIIDDMGRHFNVNNSIWYWKWNSIEDWAKIQKGECLLVKYYGIRSPLLGLFPNIVKHTID